MHCSFWRFGQIDTIDLSLIKPPPVGPFCLILWCQAFTVWPRVTPTVDDSGVHVCFLPLPKPSTWLPVLCWGSLSVHTAVMARIAAKQPENRTANNIRKANHSFSCWSTFGLRRFYQCEENNFLTKNIGRFPISQHKIHLNWVLYFYWIIAIKC